MTTNDEVLAEVAGLREDTQGLRSSIDSFDAKIEQKADEVTTRKLDELEEGRQRNRRLALAALALVLAVIVAAIAVVAFVVRNNSDRIDDQNTDRASRSYGSCVQFNVKQDADRDAIVQGIVASLRESFPSERTEAFVMTFEPKLRANVERLLPYRDCSPAGIEEFLKHPPPDPNGG